MTAAQRRSRFFSEDEGFEDVAAQTPRVGVTHMVDPALHAGVELGEADLAALPRRVAFAEPAARLHDLARLDPPVRREDDEAKPGNSRLHRLHLRAACVKRQARRGRLG